MESRIDALEQEVQVLKYQVSQQVANINAQKQELIDQLNAELTQHKLVMHEIVEGAKTEFTNIQTAVKSLYEDSSKAVIELKDRMENVEKSGGKQGGMKGYLPVKAMLPGTFTDKVEDWRQWQEDVMDYFDNINPGMKEFLKEVEAETETVDDEWLRQQAHHSNRITSDELQVWRALKTLTTGEARKVITSIKTENGFRAWQTQPSHYAS